MAVWGLCCVGFSSCREWELHSCGVWASHAVAAPPWSAAPGTGLSSCRAWARCLRFMGLAAPQHVGSSWTRDQTWVPCVGQRSLNHSKSWPIGFPAACCLASMWFFPPLLSFISDVWAYLFVTLRISHFWLGSGRHYQRGQPPPLGSLLLAFFFGLLHPLGQELSIFCSLFLIFQYADLLQNGVK